MFNCCSGANEYEQVRREPPNMDPPEEETDGYDPDEINALADQADLHVAEQAEPAVEATEQKEVEIVIDVIDDDDDKDPDAPEEAWGVARVMARLRSIQDPKKRKEQVTIAKVMVRLVDLCEATQPSRQILSDRGLDLLLELLPKFNGVYNIQTSICNAIQFLCLKSFAGEDQYRFPESGARPLKEMIVACGPEQPSALIAVLDCVSVFARVRDDYAVSTIDTGIIPVLYEMVQANLRQEDAFSLQISLTRVIVSISRSENGRAELGDKCVPILLEAMRAFKNVQDLVGNCTEAMWYLCKVQSNAVKMLELEITEQLTETMRNKYVGQDLHTKIIALLHQLVSQDGIADIFVEDERGLELLSELLIDNSNVTENYVVVLQIWITLLAHMSENKRNGLVDASFVQRRALTLAPVLESPNREAREASLTILLIVVQTMPDAIGMIAESEMMGGLLRVAQSDLTSDAIQCLMVIYYKLSGSIDTQTVLFEGGIMDFMASDWYKSPGISGEAIKSAAATLIRLYANPNYHQLLDDKIRRVQRIVALKDAYPDAAGVLDDLDAALRRTGEASSVFVTVAAPESDEKDAGEGGVALKAGAEVNVKLAVGQAIEVYSKSQDAWLDGQIRDIADGRICVVYSNREKWLKKTSKQWRPRTDQIQQAARTRSGTTARQREEEKDTYGNDEEPSQDYAAGEPGAATEPDVMSIPDVGIEFNTSGVIEHTASRRLESPRPPDSNVARPHTRRATLAASDEMDYDVEFPDKKLGLELRPGDENKNCVVSRCLSEFTQQRIDEEAYIVQVNGQWVKDLPFDTIYQIIVKATKSPPLMLMFRSKIDEADQQRIDRLADTNHAGTLKIHVVEANQLITRARYAKVKLPGEKKQTSSVLPSESPSWPDTLNFTNFQLGSAQSCKVVIYSQNRLLKDNQVGQVDIPLPRTFYKLERHMNVPLLDKKNKMAGSVSVTVILTESTARESHMMRDNVQFSMAPGDSMALSDDER